MLTKPERKLLAAVMAIVISMFGILYMFTSGRIPMEFMAIGISGLIAFWVLVGVCFVLKHIGNIMKPYGDI